MVDLLQLQKYFILSHLGEGDTAVDFTMGNGHDTAFLSKTVGPTGSVTAFDIQPKALISTEATLKAEGCPDNWRRLARSRGRICQNAHQSGHVQSRVYAGQRQQAAHHHA